MNQPPHKTSQEVGYVISSRNFLVYLDGLPHIQINDMIENGRGIKGWVTALLDDKVEALILDEASIRPGEMFKKIDRKLAIEVGPFLVGRAINSLGIPIDGKGVLSKTKSNEFYNLDRDAKGIYSRKFITDQFITGLTIIDTLIPIGKGQRELIMGDAHSGKTSFLINLIVNQKGKGVICIYASIGKPVGQVRHLIDALKANKSLEHTIIIAASSSDPAPMIFLTPQTAFAIAEYFQSQGKEVLLILDDLGNHAKIYREISLLANKSPGKESYPGDIFYQHAHLIERAGNFLPEYGGGSITTLPVIELNLNDFTTFIPTNLMAMTDGHLLFKSSLHNQGQIPAIDISLSVSRVGRQTQMRVQNLLSQKIRQILAEATQLETVSRFSSELPYETQILLKQKVFIEEIIKQESLTFVSRETQVLMLGLVFSPFLLQKDIIFLRKNKRELMDSFSTHPQLIDLVKIVPQIQSLEDLSSYLTSITPVLESIVSQGGHK